MTILQISSAQGPVECCKAVALAYQRICSEAEKINVDIELMEQVGGPVAGTFRSLVIILKGDYAQQLAKRWCGSIQWICTSRLRPGHRRKNWFIGIQAILTEKKDENLISHEMVFESMRSSGPGGQHVNTTETAIRATHVATGVRAC